MQLGSILLFLLFSGGFSDPGSFRLSPIPEYRGEGLSNTLNSMTFEAEDALEDELLRLTNQQRISQGLKPLVADDSLTQIARAHSYEMAQQGFISHDKPSGDLKTRMDRAGYSYGVVRENVACARTVLIAQNLLIDSTPHKNNILAGDVTRVGIGIARYSPSSDRHLYITEIFADPRGKYSPAAVQNLALNRVNALRSRGGLPSIQPDALFENLALRHISALKLPVKREELQRLLADSAGELISEGRTELSRLDVAVQLLHNPQNISIPDQAGAGMFGTAVRRVTDSHNQSAFLVLTLIGSAR